MSITVADCMKLPALSEAKVVSGHKGLNKIVSAVSVLEYAEASVLIDNLFVGNELVISAFTSIKDDVEAQCNAIRRLHETGEVGLVLYYWGIFLPSIDPRVLKISEELELPIIVMPEDRFDFRYSEVIVEVMEAVFRDQMQETYFVSGMLDRIAQLQERQRTIGSLFRMLSDRLRCSLLLIDRALTQRASAAWPMSMRWDYDLLLGFLRQGNLAQAPVRLSLNDRDVWVDHIAVELEYHRACIWWPSVKAGRFPPRICSRRRK